MLVTVLAWARLSLAPETRSALLLGCRKQVVMAHEFKTLKGFKDVAAGSNPVLVKRGSELAAALATGSVHNMLEWLEEHG